MLVTHGWWTVSRVKSLCLFNSLIHPSASILTISLLTFIICGIWMHLLSTEVNWTSLAHKIGLALYAISVPICIQIEENGLSHDHFDSQCRNGNTVVLFLIFLCYIFTYIPQRDRFPCTNTFHKKRKKVVPCLLQTQWHLFHPSSMSTQDKQEHSVLCICSHWIVYAWIIRRGYEPSMRLLVQHSSL